MVYFKIGPAQRCNQHPGGGGIPCSGYGARLLADLALGQSQSAASRPQLSGSPWVHWLNLNTALTFSLGRCAAPAYESGRFADFDTRLGPYSRAAAAATFDSLGLKTRGQKCCVDRGRS